MTTMSTVLDQLVTEGRLTPDARATIIPTLTAPDDAAGTAWYVRALVGISAWIAAVLLIAFLVGGTQMLRSGESLIGVGLFSHMHVRGRDMTFIAQEPNKEPETLLQIPNYSFDWQIAYAWAPGTRRFPAGTKLDCIAHYDNSTFNPYNPNPEATVREGQQTYEEMMNGFFFYVLEKEKLGIKIDGATGRAGK